MQCRVYPQSQWENNYADSEVVKQGHSMCSRELIHLLKTAVSKLLGPGGEKPLTTGFSVTMHLELPS